jgi:hypothetical protein
MTAGRGGARSRAAAVGAVVAALLATLLAGCAPARGDAPSPRTAANAAERRAVELTTHAFEAETGDARIPWVQLWTSAQFPSEMQHCVGDQSLSQLSVHLDLPEQSLSYSIVGSGSWPDEAAAARIIARCAAATPLDDRVLRLEPRDWDALYSYELTTLRPCLLARGYPVTRVPSRAAFERRLSAQHPWSPYDTVTVPTRFAWYALSDACPALPAALDPAALDPTTWAAKPAWP